MSGVGHPQRSQREFQDGDVAEVFLSYPSSVLPSLLLLREIIFDTAARTDGVGELEETLRWGEPSYLTTKSGSGSMIRVGPKGRDGRRYAIFFHCKTDLVSRFREQFPRQFRFEGNRAIVFEVGDHVPMEDLRRCISMALTYHEDRGAPRRAALKGAKLRRTL